MIFLAHDLLRRNPLVEEWKRRREEPDSGLNLCSYYTYKLSCHVEMAVARVGKGESQLVEK